MTAPGSLPVCACSTYSSNRCAHVSPRQHRHAWPVASRYIRAVSARREPSCPLNQLCVNTTRLARIMTRQRNAQGSYACACGSHQAAGAPPVRHCATEGSRGLGSGYTVLSARSAADVPAALTPSSRVSSTGSVASSSGRSSGRNARASMGAAGRASANAGVNAASSSSDASANGVKRASEKLPPDHGGAPVQGTRSEPNIHAMLRATLEDGIHACQIAADERGTMADSSRADAGSSCRLNFHGTVG
eukprot:3647862-Pleurochrysis_carterae.AAC.1